MEADPPDNIFEWYKHWDFYVLSVVLAVFSLIIGLLFDWVSEMTTKYENHKTMTAFETAKVIRLTVFALCNHYFGPLYLIVSHNLFDFEISTRSFLFLRNRVMFQVIGLLCLSLVKDLLLPIVWRWMKLKWLRSKFGNGMDGSDVGMSEFSAACFFQSRIIEFGFVTFFFAPVMGLAAPLIFVFQGLSQMLMYSHLQTITHRPTPVSVKSIGPFMIILETISWGGVLTNILHSSSSVSCLILPVRLG